MVLLFIGFVFPIKDQFTIFEAQAIISSVAKSLLL
jgi:hypothetical protein